MIVFYSGHGAGYSPKHKSNPENCFGVTRAVLMLTYFEVYAEKSEGRRLLRYVRLRRRARGT